jgi:excisionase family DNA binding protein
MHKHDGESGKLLKTKDVASYLNVSTQSVIRWWKDGKIPGFRIGGNGQLRFDSQELERWLRQGPEAAEPPASSVVAIDSIGEGDR